MGFPRISPHVVCLVSPSQHAIVEQMQDEIAIAILKKPLKSERTFAVSGALIQSSNALTELSTH